MYVCHFRKHSTSRLFFFPLSHLKREKKKKNCGKNLCGWHHHSPTYWRLNYFPTVKHGFGVLIVIFTTGAVWHSLHKFWCCKCFPTANSHPLFNGSPKTPMFLSQRVDFEITNCSHYIPKKSTFEEATSALLDFSSFGQREIMNFQS